MMNERKIKQLLHRAPDIASPEGLYEAIRNDLGIRVPEPRPSFFAKPILGIPRFATVMILLIGATALAGGIAAISNMIRWESWRDVPAERRSGVNEPIVYHAEDIAPLPPDVLGWLREFYQGVDQRNQAGEKWYAAAYELRSDGAIVGYGHEPAERMFGKNMEIHTFYSTFHPNDNLMFWLYNEDGSPVIIKNVKPLHRNHVSATGVVGMTSNRNNGNINYQFEFEKPRSKFLWSQSVPTYRHGQEKFSAWPWDVQKIDARRWRATCGNASFDLHDGFCIDLKMPKGVKVLSCKPPAQIRVDAQHHPIVTFDEKFVGHESPPLEVAYEFPADQPAAPPVVQ